MYIEAHPDVIAAMEQYQKKHGVLFPEFTEGEVFVRPNEALHMEKYSVRPLSDKKVAEYRKVCKIMR